MRKIFIAVVAFALSTFLKAQETIYPVPAQKGTFALIHGTIHVGNGEVIEDGLIVITDGKITSVGSYSSQQNVKAIDCSGDQIYPGLISPVTHLGLDEIEAVRSTRDDRELGDFNPNIHAAIAYNTDSKIINTVRSNGILLANIVPEGGTISGTSSVMQLDAWNWEDALYKKDGGIHLHIPYLVRFSEKSEAMKEGLEKMEEVTKFFKDAKAYYEESKHEHVNLKLEAVKGLFDKTQILFVHAELVKEMMLAVDFAKEFGFKTVIVGGSDSWKIADYLKQNNVPVIVNRPFSTPVTQDDDVNLPYKTPYLLQQAGVLYCIMDDDEMSRYRNLPFNAGTAVAFGLTKEQALQAITANTAKILGIDDKTGTIEKGKDANIVVSTGDILDMKTNNVIYAFIQGRQINLDDKQKQLYEKYKYKYNIK